MASHHIRHHSHRARIRLFDPLGFFFYLREKSFFPLCSRNILALILVPYPFSTVAKWMMYSLNFCKAQILCGQGRKSLAAYEEGGEGSSSTLKAMGGGGLASFFSSKACLLPNCWLLEGRRLGLSLVELEGAVLKPDAPDGLVFHGEERGFFFSLVTGSHRKMFSLPFKSNLFPLSYVQNNLFSYHKSNLYLLLKKRKYRQAKGIKWKIFIIFLSQRRKPQLTPWLKPFILLFPSLPPPLPSPPLALSSCPSSLLDIFTSM